MLQACNERVITQSRAIYIARSATGIFGKFLAHLMHKDKKLSLPLQQIKYWVPHNHMHFMTMNATSPLPKRKKKKKNTKTKTKKTRNKRENLWLICSAFYVVVCLKVQIQCKQIARLPTLNHTQAVYFIVFSTGISIW